MICLYCWYPNTRLQPWSIISSLLSVTHIDSPLELFPNLDTRVDDHDDTRGVNLGHEQKVPESLAAFERVENQKGNGTVISPNLTFTYMIAGGVCVSRQMRMRLETTRSVLSHPVLDVYKP